LKNKKRSKSLEDNEKKILDAKINQENMQNPNLLVKKLDYYKNLYDSKNRELEIIESTHKRRVDRVSYLEKQNQLLKQHLKSYIEEKPEKLDANQHKSDNIYNELSVYKHDYKHVFQEKLKVEEELDVLRVNYEKQNTIVNELNMELKYKLDEVRLECELKLEEKSRMIDLLNKELDEKCAFNQNLNAKSDKLMKTNNNLLEDRIKLSEVCSKLTEENNRLYKKWILIKKNENKQKILIERMKKANFEMENNKKLKRKIKKSRKFSYSDYENDNLDGDADAEEDFISEKDDYYSDEPENDSKLTFY
jgi:hypothetical protein